MKIYKTFKYRIYPSREQEVIFGKHFGGVRFVYNYFLRERIDFYRKNRDENKKGLTFGDNTAALTQLKKQPGFEWLWDIGSESLYCALQYLDAAYTHFFNKTAQFPKFKRKRSKQSFTVPRRWKISQNKLDIPKGKGIKIQLHCLLEGKSKSVTISKSPSGKYFASILCEVDIPEPIYNGSEIGIDFGLKSFLTSSSGEIVESSRFYRKSEERLKRLQKDLSRKIKGSNSWEKARIRLARQHEKVANQRQDFLHKLSKRLVCENQAIYIEDLAIENMVKNRHLAKSFHDASWRVFTDMLEYKGKWYGCRVNKIDRFFPSSKRCHVCGYIEEDLTLKVRKWLCPDCGSEHDRDLNAAMNILIIGQCMSDSKPVEMGGSKHLL